MLVLYILAGVILLVAIALFLPVSVKLRFRKELELKVKVAGITVYPKKKEKKPADEKTQEVAAGQKGFFEVLKEKKGFVGAVKEIFSFAKDCITPLKLFLRFVKFKNVRLSVGVVGEDAAKTAIDYGAVCSAVYPVLSFAENLADVDYKSIDVRADFEAKESKLEFSLKIKACVIFILIFAVRIFNEYKKFSVRNGLQ